MNKVNTHKQNNLFQFIRLFGMIFCFISSITILLFAENNLIFTFIIPLIFGFFNFYPGHFIRNISWNPGLVIFLIYSSLRYVITPAFAALSGDYLWNSKYYSNDTFFFPATCLFIYEMLVIYLVANITVRRVHLLDQKSETMTIKRRSQLIIIIFLLFSLVLIFIQPNLIKRFTFIFAEPSSLLNIYEDNSSGFFVLVINTAKLLLPIPFLYYGKKKYDYNPKTRYVVFAIIPFIISLLFIEGLRRGALLGPASLMVIIILHIFPNYRKKFSFIFGTGFLVLLLYLTFVKSIYSRDITITNIGAVFTWVAEYLDSYFVYIRHVAASIETKIVYANKSGIETFFNDIFFSFPLLGRLFTNGENRSVILFNNVFYNNTIYRDRVIPTIGQGIIYLGYIFSPLFSALFMRFTIIADKRFLKSKDLYAKYLWATIAVSAAGSISGNISLMAKNTFQTILPLAIIYTIFKRIR